MKKENKRLVAVVAVVAVVILAGYAYLVSYTGSTVPFSTVVSSSMQHDNNQSQIGVIDTGDIVMTADPDNVEIQSYVAAYETGYTSFGDYGSVIIYDRGSGNPIIHRAIVWIGYDESSGTWYSDELAASSLSWYCIGEEGIEKNAYNLSGTLIIVMNGEALSLDLDKLDNNTSGYVTKGDNTVSNPRFDQTAGIIGTLVSEDMIESVAIAEIPWLGILKLTISGNSYVSHVPNSLPSLAMLIVLIFSALLIIDAISVSRLCRYREKRIQSVLSWRRD